MRFEHLVLAAVADNKENRRRLADQTQGMNSTDYAIEFCTVAINIGRGTGKTKYILDNAKPWDLVIVHNHREAQRILAMKRPVTRDPLIMSAEEYVEHGRWRGQQQPTPRTIYIDDASRLSRRLLDILYCTVPKHPDQTFILLG